MPDVPDIDVVYYQAVALANNMREDIIAFYNGCAKATTIVHRWHKFAGDGTRETRSGTIIQKDVWTKPRNFMGF